MNSHIFGVLDDKNVTPTLLQGLQRLESKYGAFDLVGVATLMEGQIQQQQTQGQLQDLQSLLQKQPIYGRFGLAYTRWTNHNEPEIHHVRFYATERVALVCNGVIDNNKDIQEELIKLGYEFNHKNDEEIILRLLNRYYLDIGMPAEEATLVTMARLQGYFSTIALFAKENLLVAARRSCPLAIGVNENILYVGSNVKALGMLSHQVMQLEEGNPAVLRSVKKLG
jgi:glucosamine--fructose-6-phosphate aminotransferase (isomerizing)